ncbi:MAG: hypothetical protein ACI87E_000920 [Mariniblastus sp.]|jgi:hypothetical protein
MKQVAMTCCLEFNGELGCRSKGDTASEDDATPLVWLFDAKQSLRGAERELMWSDEKVFDLVAWGRLAPAN